MSGLGEEINRGKTLGAVALGGQEGKITGHGLGVAADIDHPFGAMRATLSMNWGVEPSRGGSMK